MSDEPQVITATEASRSFSELLHRVCYGGQSFVIKKGNRVMAHIGPAPVRQESTPEENSHIKALLELGNPPPPATQAESDYYQVVLEQMRKTAYEPVD